MRLVEVLAPLVHIDGRPARVRVVELGAGEVEGAAGAGELEKGVSRGTQIGRSD